MDFRKVLVLRGPNVWASFPVLELWVDLQTLKDTSSEMIPGFNERLMSWLPSMLSHRCSEGKTGGFFERLRRGTYMAHILEHVTLELQTLAGTEVGFGRARETSEEGVYRVAIEYQDETLAKDALQTARRLVLAAVEGKPFDVVEEIQRMRELAQDVCLGPSTKSIVDAAWKRGIPSRRLNSENLLQLGYGKKQRRIMAAETDRTGTIAESIAKDKDLTRRLLREAGIPVPVGEPVTSADHAVEVAEDIGYPVVVKPQDGNQGRGVATNLKSAEEVRAAYDAALHESSSVLVEKFIAGADFRLLVVGDRLVAAARRDPAQVIGDGHHSVTQLVEIVNRDPRRGGGHGAALTRIRIDEIALQVLTAQGLTPDSVPEADRVVLIRRNGNLSTGGTATDVTDQVHPQVAARAIEAAKIVGLDIAGLDVVVQDIAQPLEDQAGGIVEVNAAPGLRMHLAPSHGSPRPVGEAICDMLFPNGDSGRIPVVAITGTNGKTTTTRLIAHILKSGGGLVATTCTDGVYLGDRRIDTGDCSGPRSARSVLSNPLVDVAVLETARGGILREGLGFMFCDVAVVTNIGEGDHLGLNGIDTLEKLVVVKRTIVEAVHPTGHAVLNALDPHTAGMKAKCPGATVFFSLDAHHPVVVEHCRAGGKAVFVRDGLIVLANGETEIPFVWANQIPLTMNGRISFQVENVLAGVAACWVMNVPLETVRSRLETFASNFSQSPGRFNVLTLNGATVVVDYGHNASALTALVDAMSRFPHERRVAVYTAAGDRRDCDIIRQGEIIGNAFDKVFIYEGHYVRGREKGDTIRLLNQGLSEGLRVEDVRLEEGPIEAVKAGIESLQPGDLMLLQADEVDETVTWLQQYLQSLSNPAVPVQIPAPSAINA